MKRTSIGALILLAGSAIALTAQNADTANTQAMGRGRGGAPYAWNDNDKDGICDITGQPVGKVRGAGRGYGRGFAARQQAQAPATQR